MSVNYVELFDKDLVSKISKRINMGDIDLVDLLPLFKSGLTSKQICLGLQKIDNILHPNSEFQYIDKLDLQEISIEDFAYRKELQRESSIIRSLLLLFTNGTLTKEQHSIYDLARIIRDNVEGVNTCELFRAVSKLLKHPQIDPLYICSSLCEGNLMLRYLDDSRSNKFTVYRCCWTHEKHLQIIKKDLVMRIFFSRCIFTYDIHRYILHLEIL